MKYSNHFTIIPAGYGAFHTQEECEGWDALAVLDQSSQTGINPSSYPGIPIPSIQCPFTGAVRLKKAYASLPIYCSLIAMTRY
jgi:hypothetical protein